MIIYGVIAGTLGCFLRQVCETICSVLTGGLQSQSHCGLLLLAAVGTFAVFSFEGAQNFELSPARTVYPDKIFFRQSEFVVAVRTFNWLMNNCNRHPEFFPARASDFYTVILRFLRTHIGPGIRLLNRVFNSFRNDNRGWFTGRFYRLTFGRGHYQKFDWLFASRTCFSRPRSLTRHPQALAATAGYRHKFFF